MEKATLGGRPRQHADAKKVSPMKKCKKSKTSERKAIKEAKTCGGKPAEIHSCTSQTW